MSDFIIVPILSETCSHCRNYKTNQQTSTEKILREKGYSIETINLKTNNSGIDQKYPSNLYNYMNWFPSFLITTKDNWKNNLSDRSKVRVMNEGKDTQGRSIYVRDYSVTTDGICSWADKMAIEINGSNQPQKKDEIKTTTVETTFCKKNSFKPRGS